MCLAGFTHFIPGKENVCTGRQKWEMPSDLGQVISLLGFSLLQFSLLPLVCLSKLKAWETGVLFTFQHLSPKRCWPRSATIVITNNHDNNPQVMPCISNVLAKDCFNYWLKHMCKFSSPMGKCSYLLSALMELKSLDFHADCFSWQAVAEVYCSTGLRKNSSNSKPKCTLGQLSPFTLRPARSSPLRLMCFT